MNAPKQQTTSQGELITGHSQPLLLPVFRTWVLLPLSKLLVLICYRGLFACLFLGREAVAVSRR